MKSKYESKYYKVEEKYWIFKATRNLCKSLLGKPTNKNIAEVGCSSGVLLNQLNSKNDCIGIEKSDLAINYLKSKSIKTVQTNDYKTSLKNNSLDILIASNVLEHIKEDTRALQEWSRVIKKNGKLVIIVPAFQILWSKHDELNLHFRRYSKQELVKKINSVGKLKIEKISYWNSLLFLPVLLIRKLEKLKRNENTTDLIQPLPKWINNILIAMLNLETKFILMGIKFPFGISLVCTCKKAN